MCLRGASMSFEVPILFCIFNRPDETKRVFEAIAQRRPRNLFVIGDGPRTDVPSDIESVYATRAVLDNIDWKCNVQCNYANSNMGCRMRMATGLDWAFRQSEELIILEDDCLPDPTFFDFCASLLQRYRDQEDVMMISGDNFQPNRRTVASYYFSRWPHIWGWASWRRAWKHFDIEMTDWHRLQTEVNFASQFETREEYLYWSQVFDGLAAGQIDTWDFAWMFACWKMGGLTILPESNLVSNIGFGMQATHTRDSNSTLANLSTSPIEYLIHPLEIERHVEADRWTYENLFLPEIRRATQTQVKRKRSWVDKLLGRRKKAA